MTTTIAVAQSKGGAGASTLRVAMALVASREGLNVALLGDDPDHAAILGMASEPEGPVRFREGLTIAPNLAATRASEFDLVVIPYECLPIDGPAADKTVMATRADYLALRHAVAMPITERLDGCVLFEESGRSLGVRDVTNVLGAPCLATIGIRASTARVIDAGVLASRLPDALARPVRELLRRLDVIGRDLQTEQEPTSSGRNPT